MPSPKTFRLEISIPAQGDLEDIAQYTYGRYGQRQVDLYLNKLFNQMKLLKNNPGIGHLRDDLPSHCRVLNIARHLLIDTVEKERILIVRILHQSCDVGQRF